ncbi:phage terminase large subunit family protein [Xylophilus ampelinus]|uniref:Phage terminase large subunit GpA-like protein n=1 Tax=Xylophilus ampelinus TaxID=54067 RepID=A0A318SLU2_9BURK|nr:terminase gpA endonuclease subunit [Xylophilus ampelinus]MCS4508901.1 phage terminase large subunit family protein [Xylophilus ampelinus]PYE79468.1 phage terminase large subunit GpA-like protein [Xylophilus ampelinus]
MSALAAVARQSPRTTRLAVAAAVRDGLALLRAVVPQPLSDWAADHFYLSAESSHAQGQWEAYPFQIALMDWMSDDRITELTVKKSKRVGYTKILLAFMAYNAAHRRRKQALWQPTDDDRDSFVKGEVEPMLRDVKALRRVALTGGGEDTMKFKRFVGSVLHLLGGKAARAFRRITVAVSLLDELDAFDQQIEKSSDPITLARGRLEGAPFPKLVAGSTPRIKGLSHTDARHTAAGAQMVYNIACPHCDAEHPLTWGGKTAKSGFKWNGQPGGAHHVCPHCGESITQADYLGIWREGVWIDHQHRYRYGPDRIWRDGMGVPCQPPEHVGSHVWAAYSPQRTWDDIVREFLEAHVRLKQGDPGPMQGFVNETRGDVWEEASDRADEHALMQRAEDYALRTVPHGGLVLVAGVDIQDTWFEIVVWAIGRGEEMWVVDHVKMVANPAEQADWEKLDAYLLTSFPHANGSRLGIEAAAVDTGGHFTHQVYNFCRLRERRRIFAVKGDKVPGKPVAGRASAQDVNFRGQVVRRGVKLWMVGTDTAKDLIYGRLIVTQPGPGYVHTSKHLAAEFYFGLTAESRVLVKTATGTVYRWENMLRKRNEPLDCTVYAIFATHRLGLHTYTDRQWQRLESAMAPDLFAQSAPTSEPAPAVSYQNESGIPAVRPAMQPPRVMGSRISLAGTRRACV